MVQFRMTLYRILFFMVFNGDWNCGYIQKEMTLINLSHSIIFTSPLRSGSNSTELLVSDFTKPPTCLVSLPLIPSWILIDFGFKISGISQIRLVSDNYLENAHEFLDDIEVDLAEYVPYSIIKNSNFSNTKYFHSCGNTGTISSDTVNVVVDCVSHSTVRWVLVKRNGPLNLCYVQILQDKVKPECFQRLNIQNSFYEKAKNNLSVFRSKRHITFLKCLQNCDTESQCNAVAFMPLKYGAGICQLLRFREFHGDYICDDSCNLIINRCQLGERVRLENSEGSEVITISLMNKSSYVITIEVNGVISCDVDRCGDISLLLKDFEGNMYKCGSVDHLMYRILLRTAFMCERPVQNPQQLIIKYNSEGPKVLYDFTSIHIRFVEKDSLPLNYLKAFNHFIMKTESSYSVLSTAAKNVYKRKKETFAFRNLSSKQSTLSTSNVSKNQNLGLNNDESLVFLTKISKIVNKKTTMLKTNKEVYTITMAKFTSTLENRISTISTKKIHLKKKERTSTKYILENVKDNFMQKPTTEVYTSFQTFNGRKNSQTTVKIFFYLNNFNGSNSVVSNNKTTFSLKTINSRKNYVLFVWLILLVFGSILVFVTAIVVLITYIEGKRKIKQWDLPIGGLCPSDHDSEPLTTHSSINMSQIRQSN